MAFHTIKNIDMKKDPVYNALKKWVDKHPEDAKRKPYMRSGKKTYTLTEMLNEVKKRTDFGNSIRDGVFSLVVELLSRQKIAFPGYEGDVQIKPIQPQVVPVYDPNDVLMGNFNYWEWNELRIQCRAKQLDGYYAMFDDKKIVIDSTGKYPPVKGFFDLTTTQMVELF